MKLNKIRTNNMDKITLTFSEMENILEALSENDGTADKAIRDSVDYLTDLFKEVLIVLVPDDYERYNAMNKILTGGDLRKQAIVLTKDEKLGKLIPKTGWLQSDGALEYVEDACDIEIVKDAILVLTYVYLMSEKNNETGETTYDESIVYTLHEKKVVEMKKSASKKMVRKVKIKSRKEITFNITKGDVKRIYNRISEAWSVRGHWREYKNGHRVWIKAYEKGNGKKTAKEYEI